ncbi:MAG: sensor histidine kinase [Actinobacteria bacterium HGW-Actinobacteria-7]|jgi:signal transduction histidine kinase|nr:MAG: sensor histidine kinase [Actinobacteria bacterium HGW-Actinobacteria-7]
MQRIADSVAQVAQDAYPQYGGWTIETLSVIPRVGQMRGVAVQILDKGQTVIYDDTTNLRSIHGAVLGENFILNPTDPVVSSPVTVNNISVGTVRVWAYGEGALLTDRDAQFRSGSLTALIAAAVVAMLMASLGGFLYANRLVRPIQRITETAVALRRGDREARTMLEGNDEIAVLARTLDEMADAIEADRELERRLTADVAHELRTPLQAIQATVEAMQDGVLPADEERLGVVRDETIRLGRLADGILELTRLERGSLAFDIQRIDLSQSVRTAAEAHQALMDARELEFTVEASPGAWVLGDADRLKQAISNLLSNAARYTPPGGRVELRVSNSAKHVNVAVSDTGIGISDEDMSNVFSRFWRADAARATATGGLGIGLAVTKEIIERHKGSIIVGRRPQGGTTFTLRLPRA